MLGKLFFRAPLRKHQVLAMQRVGHGPVAWASFGNLLDMQSLGPHCIPAESGAAIHKIPRGFPGAFTFKKH